ncbi:hypothetical protein E2C01_034946 [Portunus trituberculatus]|uniref:Uncharacterized protein n=1 Tax=Portunus trituberculatus TaxID=210409 RepID=A0A5B7F737_PORTR|nr:hypothetical protein [Portunus trituberculatus]
MKCPGDREGDALYRSDLGLKTEGSGYSSHQGPTRHSWDVLGKCGREERTREMGRSETRMKGREEMWRIARQKGKEKQGKAGRMEKNKKQNKNRMKVKRGKK